MGANPTGKEVTIKIGAIADASLGQTLANAKQALQQTFEAAKNAPQDLNQQFMTLFKTLEMRSQQASNAMLSELKQITSGISTMTSEMAKSQTALANMFNQPATQGANLGNIAEQVEEGTSKALMGAQAAQVFTQAVVKMFTESVTSSIELVKSLDEVRDRLDNITHSASKTSEIMRSATSFSLDSGTSIDSLRKASIEMAVFHTDVKKHLADVADLAAYRGKPVEQVADTFGRAMDGQKKAFLNLRTQYDIGASDLARYGAELDKTGNIALKTSAEIEKAGKALVEWIRAYAGGASKPSSIEGELTAAKNAIQALREELAKPLTPVIQSLTSSFRDIVSWLTKLPPGLKETFAGIFALGTGIAVVTTGFLALASPLNNAIILLGKWKIAAVEAKAAQDALNVSQAVGAGGIPAAGQAAGVAANSAKLLGGFAGPIIAAAVVLATIGTVAIEAYEKKSIALGEAIKKESKDVATANKEWKDFVTIIHEAGKGQGDVAKASHDISKELQNISAAIDATDVQKLREILGGKGGYTAESFKKVADDAKNKATMAKSELELLDKVGKTVTTTPARKFHDKEGTDYTIPESRQLNLNKLSADEQAAYKQLMGRRDASSVDVMEQARKEKDYEYRELQKRSEGIAKTNKKTFTEPERMLAGMSDREESTKSFLVFSEQAKGAENLTEKLKILKEQAKINEKEFMKIKLNIPSNIPDLLKYIEQIKPSDKKLREIAEGQMRILLDVKKTEEKINKEATDKRIKEINEERNATQQMEEDGLANHTINAEKKQAIDKLSLKDLDKISSGSLLRQGEPVKEYLGSTDMTKKKVEKSTGIGPKTEDQQLIEDQERYEKDAKFKEYIDEKKLSDKKKIVSQEKGIDAEHLKELELKYEDYLTSRREATKYDIQAQINDLNFVASEYERQGKSKEISEEAANKKIVEIRKNTTNLTIKLQEKERDAKLSLMGTVEKGLTQQMDILESGMGKGEDNLAKIEGVARKRLQVEFAIIEEERKKRLEMEGQIAEKRTEIELDAQQKRLAAVEKEEQRIDALLKKVKKEAEEAANKRWEKSFGGFQAMSAFGSGPKSEGGEIQGLSGFSSQIDIGAKKKGTLAEQMANPDFASLRPDMMAASLGVSIKDELLPATTKLTEAFNNLSATIPSGFTPPQGVTPQVNPQASGASASTTQNNTYNIAGTGGATPPADMQVKLEYLHQSVKALTTSQFQLGAIEGTSF